ncbi:hypothetical protein PHYPSEUDO_008928 [Phytophthora pseudosyringae]|uniref:Uncharacterized protein n=1 Tax=Phytophthora pseudosyringae TaxID=221518 RepID=A0A8T1VD39_9STRA|nr:hypothetical protein PHYPSEUDO_008928 [Phytophthora pseudosyringae]
MPPPLSRGAMFGTSVAGFDPSQHLLRTCPPTSWKAKQYQCINSTSARPLYHCGIELLKKPPRAEDDGARQPERIARTRAGGGGIPASPTRRDPTHADFAAGVHSVRGHAAFAPAHCAVHRLVSSA